LEYWFIIGVHAGKAKGKILTFGPDKKIRWKESVFNWPIRRLFNNLAVRQRLAGFFVFLRIWELSKLRELPLIFQEIRISLLGLHFLIVQ